MTDLRFSGSRTLPIIQSTEAAECGLACLCMVANYHGHSMDLNAMRQRFAMSMSGANLKTLMTIAEAIGLAPRALRAELEQLKAIPTPAILHWNLNHFVVLKTATRAGVVVHDPARGPLKLSWEEASRHFTGVVLELDRAGEFQPIKDSTPTRLSSLWSSMTGFWPSFVRVMALSFALQGLALSLPFQIQLVVDAAIPASDAGLLTIIAAGFLLIAVFESIVEALRAWSITIMGQSISFQLVRNIVRHMLRLPADWFEKRHVGDIISRIGSSTALQDFMTNAVIATLLDGAMAVIACVILFVYAPSIALIVVAGLLVNLIIALAFFPAMRARTEEHLVRRAQEQSHLMETIRAAAIIKLMGAEHQREGTWRGLYAGAINAATSLTRLEITRTSLQNLVNGSQTVIVVYMGALAVINADGFSLGMLMAFLSFRQIFVDRANALIAQVVQFKFLHLHLERLSDIVGSPRAPLSVAASRLTMPETIELRDVSFRYGASDAFILKDFNLSIAGGEYVAISGPSGGGKSTILKLILGLREPTSGRLLVNGQDLKPEHWQEWRRNIGVVSQDDRLLSGTIAENIAFFDTDMDMERVIRAARAAQLHRDIQSLPMKYLSLVGDMGSTLSGGQRQRLLLARALYREPSILILDEGTANLDVETEALIANLIERMPITRIIVAHRPALLDRAHRVIRLERPISS